ncbi:lysine-specific demethylase JMJ28 isoform X2 [Amaranthus tricolor]|uniref:lysine-specific demethylase JMJ28 isoform X2 n=1 Tax=Amaranthus tricolor TaxID=29722 RepID=UPI00258BFBC6|nr:lysine-specific demethylase JMJ28 isoform X2 [Amaranthus tricolor]
MEGVLEEPMPPDDLRCKKSDGRDWRCKRRIVDGNSFCLSHLRRTLKCRPTPAPNPKPESTSKPRLKPEPESEPISGFEFNPLPECEFINEIEFNSLPEREPSKEFEFNPLPEREPSKEFEYNPLPESEPINEFEFSPLQKPFFPPVGTVPDHLRCNRNDGRKWRCKKQALEGQTMCEIHINRVKAQSKRWPRPIVRKKKEQVIISPVGENIRCVRNNGKVLRCKNNVVEGFSPCENHMKKNYSNSNRKNGFEKENVHVVEEESPVAVPGKKHKRKKNNNNGVEAVAVVVAADELRCKRTDGREWRCKRRVLEGKTLCEIHYEQAKLRQKRITVPEELKIQRGEGSEKVEKRLKRKKEIEALESNSDKGMKKMRADLIRVFLRRALIESTKKSEKQIRVHLGEITRDLPYGSMAIPPVLPNQVLYNAAGCLGIKIGGHCSSSLVTRRFRSKNIEPPLIGAIVPFPGKSGKKKCHWCRKFDYLSLIECSSCKKRYFCSNCINGRSADLEEIKLRCPVCRRSCDCKTCYTTRSKNAGSKEALKETFKRSRFEHLQYLISFLLPILVKINQDQGVELEIEANFKGQNPADVEIRQAGVGYRDQCCCNNCKIPILDFHRSCPNCSYNLCLSCCREYAQGGGSLGVAHPDGTETLLPCRKNVDGASSVPLQGSTSSLHISCPPMELGGCDNSLLDLRCIFPLNWTKELEISAAETVFEHDFLHFTDDSVHCSMCTNFIKAGVKSNDLQEVSRRKDFNDNFLYCPSSSDDPDCLLAHFQKHWLKGHPVKVCNVLQCTFALSWDPLHMFCSFLENDFSKCENREDAIEAASCFGSYDVEIGTKESFTGSIDGYMNACHETLRLNAKMPAAFSQKLLEGHCSEIIHSLPLQEYTNPKMGLLNIAGKLPEDFPASKLGPHVCISCGSRDEVARGGLVTRLCCNSFDEFSFQVNVLIHVADTALSSEQLNEMMKLIKQTSNQKDQGDRVSNKNLEDDDTRLHSDISVEAGDRHWIADASCCSAGTVDAPIANNHRENKSSAAKLANGSDTNSDDSMICSEASYCPDKTVDQIPQQDHLEGLNVDDKQSLPESCGAQWDVFRRQDIPKLLDYMTKHVDEISSRDGLSNDVVHPILDGNFYLDTVHKKQLKQEFEIEPWTFNQCLGEAVFIPAGCPYQIKYIKSCINISAGFISPENASECIKLINEIRVLPNDHKAKQLKLEVEKMTIWSVDEAIKEIYRMRSEEGSR